MPKRATSTSFVKGDKRINRDGRPRNGGELGALARRIGAEIATTKDGKPVLGPDGKPLTVIETILRQKAQDRKYQEEFLNRAYGKVPDRIAGADGEAIQVRNTQAIDLSGLTIDERQSLVTLIAKLESPEA